MRRTWVRDETICSFGRLRALASYGAVKRAKRERVVEVGSETEEGLNWALGAVLGRERALGGGDGEE